MNRLDDLHRNKDSQVVSLTVFGKSVQLAAAMILSLSLTGCGIDKVADKAEGDNETAGQSVAQSSISLAVNTVADLPTCDDTRISQLAYVVDEELFKVCNTSGWAEVEIKGKDGEAGHDATSPLIQIADEGPGNNCAAGGKAIRTGLDNDGNELLEGIEVHATEYVCNGVAGANGIDGTDNRIITTYHCTGTIDGTNAQGLNITSGVDITYNAALFASGDVFVSANISGASYQTSGSIVYAASQNGAANAAVFITDDYFSSADYGWWRLSINFVTNIPTAVFNNSTLPTSSTRTWNFDACTVNNY